MKIRVKCFAWAKEVTGEDEIDLEVPEGATVADLRDSLAERFPVFSGRMESIPYRSTRSSRARARPWMRAMSWR